MTLSIQEMTSGVGVDLTGEKLEMFEEQLTLMVQCEIDDSENYLDEEIRPRISDNYDYYNRELPKSREGEPSFTDNTCQATVDHAVAHCIDAFTPTDTVEIVPMGITNPMTNRVINAVVNDVLDSENERFRIYSSFFKDSFISGASILKPHVTENTIIEKKGFIDISPEEVAMRQMDLETSDDWDEVELTIIETKEEEITIGQPIPEGSMLQEVIPDASFLEQTQTVVTQSGYFTLITKERTIKIEQIPAENFLINREAKSIEDSKFVGHKAMVTVGSLLEMGFDYDKVSEVGERCGGDDDPSDNIASNTRRRSVIGDTLDNTSLDSSMKEVELFEVYIKTALEETVGSEDENKVAIPKLFQVFMAGTVLLDYQEVDFIPYVGTSPAPVPHMFWGHGLVDKTKDIQRARTGLMRQQFVFNDLVLRPKFTYVPDQVVNPRDLFNPQAGAGIGVKSQGAVQPLQLTALAGDNSAMLAALEVQRENGTGVTYTGQSLMGEALKAGASTLSAQMVLTEQQKMIKAMIQTLMEGAIKPLVEKIYNLLRENFDEWEITVDGETFTVSPNGEWPRLREIKVVTPLGKTAKLEKAQTYMSLYTTLATAQGEAAKLVDPMMLRQLLVDAFEAQDIPDATSYLPPVEQIQAKDELTAQVGQMSQMLQQMQVQLKTLSDQNQVLTVQASEMNQKQLELDERRLVLQEQKEARESVVSDAKLTNMADEQSRKQQETDADIANMADKQVLAEAEFNLKEQLAEEDRMNEVNTRLSFN